MRVLAVVLTIFFLMTSLCDAPRAVLAQDNEAAALVDVSMGDDITAGRQTDDNGQNIAVSVSASSRQ